MLIANVYVFLLGQPKSLVAAKLFEPFLGQQFVRGEIMESYSFFFSFLAAIFTIGSRTRRHFFDFYKYNDKLQPTTALGHKLHFEIPARFQVGRNDVITKNLGY